MARRSMLSRMVRVKAKNLDGWISGLSDEERQRLWDEWIDLMRSVREAIEAWFREWSPIFFDWIAGVQKALEEIGPPMASNGGPITKEEPEHPKE